ncbi:flagellar filament capping protein FliD [Sphingomonas turrisvirgatae]|uniref:flagellar filament capping protein FliD n=1 Tax=Sphingomonas turrisvirgatae TaxID=1888892 RepID=UPI0009A159B6|nr:flagellar filament capping protein FliD [Sphingomonas turrisvirgatae]
MAVEATTNRPSSASIVQTLGGGSGIDTSALVQSLVDAQFESRNAALAKREETLTAQISAAATHKSNITGFSTALSTLSRSGNLATQPTSSNSGIVNVTRLSGAVLTDVNARVEVRQLAAAQTASTAPVTDKAAPVGQGTLTLTFGTASVADGAMSAFMPGAGASVDIIIDASNSSLQGIAAAINARNAGVTASILTDSAGSRLVIKGGSGEARAFTLEATETPGEEGLSALNIGIGASGTTIGSAAADAIVAIDGVAIKRDSNTIADLVPGVKLDLVSAQIGVPVNIGKTLPTNALLQAVSDFVDTYNEVFAALNKDLDPVTGSLKQDIAAKALKRQLQQLTLAPLASGAGGAPTTLSQIGVRTNRDGSITLDSTALSRALVNSPDAVEKMFAAPSGAATTGNGLAAALGAIAAEAANTTRGLGASEISYTKAKSDIATDKTDALAKADALRTRMTRQFASMDAKVAAYKSTQTFIENQVKAWNSQD